MPEIPSRRWAWPSGSANFMQVHGISCGRSGARMKIDPPPPLLDFWTLFVALLILVLLVAVLMWWETDRR
jgi:hypothetical protein